MKLCSRHLMLFGQNFSKKRQIWVSEPHFGQVRGDAQRLLIVRWKANSRLSIRLNYCTFFAIYCGSGAMRRNVYSLDVVTGGSISLHSNFTWTGSSPINHSWHQKTRDAGLPDGEDRILLHSLLLTQYQSVTDEWIDVPQHIQWLCCAL